MAIDFTKIGRVAPVYKGVWSAVKGYERLDIVSTTDRATAYIARKAVPSGAALGDTDYWAPVLDVKDTLNTVRGAASTIDVKLDGRTTDLERISGGDFRQIVLDNEHDTRTYKEVDGLIVEGSAVPGSGYIACPKHLCLEFGDADARCYLYFYDLVDGEYIPRWDILSSTTSTGAKNYINANSRHTNMLDIPDGVYMQASVAVGTVRMYGWDGEPFGMPLSADETMRSTGGVNGILNAEGSSGLVIPGAAKYVCCKDAAIFSLWGFRSGVLEAIDTAYARRFWSVPEGYEWFKARLYFAAEAPYPKITYIGDISDKVSVIVDAASEKPSGRAGSVINACRQTAKLAWTPVESLYVRGEEGATYKSGVEYNGIPYSSQWTTAHFVGWHISPHTFANAASDAESVLYKEKAEAWGEIAPYYGTVCSAFATMCDGWPYPQTNAGFIYDPNVLVSFAANPPVGAVYSDLHSHCLITERVDFMGAANAVSVYEAWRPLSGRRTRYSYINGNVDPSSYDSATLDGYLDAYGYIAHHVRASNMQDAVPYADFDDVQIVNAAVLPYKGDRCVHTSEDANMYINIKDPAAVEMIVTAPDGAEFIVPIAGATRVDLKSYLAQDGIYYLRTDTNAERASFEYRTVTPVEYTVTDGVIAFARNDFWYAMVSMRGDRLFEGAEACAMPCRADGDYSDWSANGRYAAYAYCVFYKGTYGAYPVSVVKR